jgi:phosphoribosylaminoimidazole-succinocarboxamide synthase
VFWFETTGHICPNHLISTEVPAEAEGRGLRVKRLEMYPVECVVRGYITGSGLKDYRKTGAICGIPLPAGLQESDRLETPIFTPSTKAEAGHDENISFETMAATVGRARAEELREKTLEVYRRGRAFAEERGIILADTKLEFGLKDGRVVWIDEALTPDSSRFWPKDGYTPGRSQPSFDKQFVRDYLEGLRWDKQPPGPALPDDVVARTRDKYREAYARLTGASR